MSSKTKRILSIVLGALIAIGALFGITNGGEADDTEAPAEQTEGAEDGTGEEAAE